MHYSLKRPRPMAQFWTNGKGQRRMCMSEQWKGRVRSLNFFDRLRYAQECVHQKKIRHAHLGKQASILRFRCAVGDLRNLPF